jgi:hypothetical protein
MDVEDKSEHEHTSVQLAGLEFTLIKLLQKQMQRTMQ